MLVWLAVWSDVQTCICPSCSHYHSLSLASVKSRLVSSGALNSTPTKQPGQGVVKWVCVSVCILGITVTAEFEFKVLYCHFNNCT